MPKDVGGRRGGERAHDVRARAVRRVAARDGALDGPVRRRRDRARAHGHAARRTDRLASTKSMPDIHSPDKN